MDSIAYNSIYIKHFWRLVYAWIQSFQKKLTINGLKGNTSIKASIRRAIGIEEGVLSADVKSWCDFTEIIDNYTSQADDPEIDGNFALDKTISDLEHTKDIPKIENLPVRL
jgi:hypothetical protein